MSCTRKSDIETRLDNWARAQRSGPGGGDGMVANIYFPSVRGETIDSSIDVKDAAAVETAVRKLIPLDRKILQMHYVWRASPPVICRRLGLKVRPTTIFDLALAHARRAVEEKLIEPRPVYVSMQSIVDKMNKGLADSD